MHEWALASSIVTAVDRWARENNTGPVVKVVVSIPRYSFIELDILQEAFNTLKQGSMLNDATLEVRVKPARLRCRSCGFEFSEDDIKDQINNLVKGYGEEYPLHLMPDLLPSFIKCPRCGSHDLEVINSDIKVDEVHTRA